MTCPQCGARVFTDDDGPYCLMGHRPQKTLAELEREDEDVIQVVKRQRGHGPRAQGVKL